MLDHCYLIPGSISVTASSGYSVLYRILPRGEKLGKKVKYNFFSLLFSPPSVTCSNQTANEFV